MAKIGDGWPHVSHALAAHLDALYPEQCIQPNQTEAQAREYAGVRRLVNLLRDVSASQLPEGAGKGATEQDEDEMAEVAAIEIEERL